MSKLRRVYLPRWMGWFAIAIMAPLWLWMTYQVFATERGRADLGIGGWVIMTIVLVLVGVVIWLMGTRRLPAYLIEDDDESP